MRRSAAREELGDLSVDLSLAEFDGASADADWMRSWQSRPLERREVVLQGRAGGTTSEVSHFRALGCTLLDARAAAAGYESVTLRCDLVLRTD